TGKFLQMTFLLYHNGAIALAPYADYARGDSAFVATPLVQNAVVTLSPYSSAAQAHNWSGLRFFRAQITPANFRAAVGMVNAVGMQRPDVEDCMAEDGMSPPFSDNPADYRISEFGLIAEIFGADTGANGVSVGLHLRGLGLYRFR